MGSIRNFIRFLLGGWILRDCDLSGSDGETHELEKQEDLEHRVADPYDPDFHFAVTVLINALGGHHEILRAREAAILSQGIASKTVLGTLFGGKLEITVTFDETGRLKA